MSTSHSLIVLVHLFFFVFPLQPSISPIIPHSSISSFVTSVISFYSFIFSFLLSSFSHFLLSFISSLISSFIHFFIHSFFIHPFLHSSIRLFSSSLFRSSFNVTTFTSIYNQFMCYCLIPSSHCMHVCVCVCVCRSMRLN